MRNIYISAAAILALTAQPVWAKGCIRGGAAAGGVAGHFVGEGHPVAGAAVGCVVAQHHYAKRTRAEKAAAARYRG